jgi:predicted DNA-binding protein with PD1-like motif
MAKEIGRMMMNKVIAGECLMGRLSHGADLLDELTQICTENDVQLGRVEGIGAVQKARVGFYNQEKREYEFMEFDEPLEILSLLGNVSIKDGKPMIHAHIALSNRAGAAFGGHLANGTVVFACEYVIQRLEGATHERGFDEETGLPLWQR